MLRETHDPLDICDGIFTRCQTRVTSDLQPICEGIPAAAKRKFFSLCYSTVWYSVVDWGLERRIIAHPETTKIPSKNL